MRCPFAIVGLVSFLDDQVQAVDFFSGAALEAHRDLAVARDVAGGAAFFAVVPAALVFRELFMKRSVAEKGAHIGAE